MAISAGSAAATTGLAGKIRTALAAAFGGDFQATADTFKSLDSLATAIVDEMTPVEGNATKYVPETPQLILSDTTPTEDEWTDIDMSGVVPAGAYSVIVQIYIRNDSVVTWLKLEKNGRHDAQAMGCFLQGTGLINANVGVVDCDDDRVIAYYTPTGGTWHTLQIMLYGYFIQGNDA